MDGRTDGWMNGWMDGCALVRTGLHGWVGVDLVAVGVFDNMLRMGTARCSNPPTFQTPEQTAMNTKRNPPSPASPRHHASTCPLCTAAAPPPDAPSPTAAGAPHPHPTSGSRSPPPPPQPPRPYCRRRHPLPPSHRPPLPPCRPQPPQTCSCGARAGRRPTRQPAALTCRGESWCRCRRGSWRHAGVPHPARGAPNAAGGGK